MLTLTSRITKQEKNLLLLRIVWVVALSIRHISSLPVLVPTFILHINININMSKYYFLTLSSPMRRSVLPFSLTKKITISKMSSIQMAMIKITIFISNMCFYVLLIIFNMLWCMTSTTHDLYHHNDNIYFHLICHYFHLFLFSFSHYCSTSDDKMYF